VHYFLSARKNQVLYGQKHCLLPRKNRHNQPQQAKARSTQKGSNLTEKFRHLQDIFRVNTGRVQPLQKPGSH
jgi:hypothetical protein